MKMRFRSAGQKRKFYRNMQFNQTSRQIGVLSFVFALYVLPLLVLGVMVYFGVQYFSNHHEIHFASLKSNRMLFMGLAAPASASGKPNVKGLISRITRDQGPEYEQTLNWTSLAQVSTPTALRTDRKIKFFDLHVRARISNTAGVPTLRTAPPLLATQLFGLIQQVTIRGQHLRWGSQTIVQMRGETAAEFMALLYPNYTPQFTVTNSAGGTNGRSGVLTTTNAATADVDFVLPIPLFPPGLSGADSVFYCLHGPDWPGNLYIDVQCADGTALATVNPPTITLGFGGVGTPSIDILSERPLLGKKLMASIRPAFTLRQQYTGQPTSTVAGQSGTGIKISDLTVGKDTTRIFLKTGVASTGASAGVVQYGSLSDGICTRTFFSLDNRPLRFQNSNADSVLQDYAGRSYGRVIPVGYKVIDFIAPADGGASPDNPKAAFASSQLTAARKFELDGDITAAANQIAEVIQEMLLGTPQVNVATAA
jgi:hypothetical protein